MDKTKRQSKRGGGPRALAAAITRLTAPVFGRRGFAQGAVVNEWAAIVGEHLALHTAPEKIVHAEGGREEGTLHLRIDSGALAIELQHLESQLIERVNGYFGYRAVSRLRLTQGPLPRRRKSPDAAPRALDVAEETDLSGRLDAIDDADLRAALDSLGRAVIGRRGTPPRK
jgi:hypothetical protein